LTPPLSGHLKDESGRTAAPPALRY